MTAIVTGASRGFGAAIAAALVEAGHEVVGLARGADELQQRAADVGFTPVAGDATDPELAAELLARYRPAVLVLNAGAVPWMGPIESQTWESFTRCWEVDTRHVFEWVCAAMRLPLDRGATVVTISSGAALRGSPLSGGYAGAKATARFITSYAAGESERGNLGLRFVTLLPQITPLAGVGAVGAAAYAERDGLSPAEYARALEPLLTPELVGRTVVEAIGSDLTADVSLLVTGGGSRPVL